MFDDLRQIALDLSERRVMNRRQMLHSAGVVIGASAVSASTIGASAMTAAAASPAAGTASMPTQEGQPQEQRTGGLRKRMMSFMLPHEQVPVPELVELGVAAEKAGFDVLATSDHFQPWQANEGYAGEAWVTMAALGARTQRVWMGTTVTCPTFRYSPAVVAEAFASLSLLYPRRIFLGVGSGEALNEQAATGEWPNWRERSERLVEATDIIRRLWTDDRVTHQGKYYNVNGRLYDRPTRKIPLLMAGNGPKAMYRCGQYADGLITDPKTWKQHKSEFQKGAREAGKDPNQMPILVEQYVIVGGRRDAERAAEFWRFGPKAFTSYFNVRDPEEIQRLADKEVSLEKVYGDWPVSTNPADHIKAVNELFASGVTIVNIHTGQADQRRVIHFYGKEVLPKVRTAAGASSA